MQRRIHPLKDLVLREDGQDMVEYALLAAFIAVSALAFLVLIAPVLGGIFQRLHSFLVQA